MMNISATFDAAVLADAAYLDFDIAPGDVLSEDQLRDALLARDRLTVAQADCTTTNYDLVAFEPAGSGDFQAAVFRDKRVAPGAPGEFVLAIRGSAELQDWLPRMRKSHCWMERTRKTARCTNSSTGCACRWLKGAMGYSALRHDSTLRPILWMGIWRSGWWASTAIGSIWPTPSTEPVRAGICCFRARRGSRCR